MTREFKQKQTKFEALEQKVKQMEMATRVNQMLLKQFGSALDKITADLRHIEANIGDLQYRLVATNNITGLDKIAMQKESDRLKLEDFNKASDAEDKTRNLTLAEVVESQEDVVIISSKTPKEVEDRGFLRSKIQIKQMNQPSLQEALVGKRVGDKVTIELNGTEHEVELLGVRKVPAPAPVAEAPAATAPTLNVVK